MKTFKYFLSILLFVAAVMSCSEDELGNLDFVSTAVAPTNLTVLLDVTPDNTGLVTITPNSEGAVSYTIALGDDETAEPISVKQGENIQHIYAEDDYVMKVVAIGITGLKTELVKPFKVSFDPPEFLTFPIPVNDAAISKRVNVKVLPEEVKNAISFDVYFGEAADETPVTKTVGDEAFHVYAEPGLYTIKVVLKGAAIEIVEHIIEDFEVTEILQPLTAALTPSRLEADVVSIFSDAYTNVDVSEWNPGWGQSTVLSPFDVNGDNILRYDYLNYTGIVTSYDNPTNLSAMEYVHFDYWTNDAEQIAFKIVNTSQPDGDPLKESEVVTPTTEFGKWVSVDIPLTDFTTDMSGITQLVVSSTGVTVFMDNIYFWKEPSTVVSALLHDDFEGNGNIDTWAGDACGMDNTFANPYVDINNGSDTVLEYNDAGGQYANVRFDAPSNFDLASNSKFSLKIYVPSSSITGSQPNQISLKLQDGTAGEPWAQQTEIIKSIVLDQWQTVTFDFATDVTAGAADPLSRTDFNRVVLQVNSENNNDTVIAYIDDFNYGVDSGPVDTPPYAMDDFEGNGTIDTWAGDACGMDNAFPNEYTNLDNNSATVLKYDDEGGQYANVRFDVAPNFDLTAKSKFTLKIYVPSSSITGSQPNQISLKLQDGTAGEPWAQQTEIIKPIVLDQWQTVTFDFATDVTAGAADPLSRTDFNRVVLQVNSENNNDTVIAYIDDFTYLADGGGTGTAPFDGGLVINGDFESGAEPWTIGVGTDPVPVVTDGGNSYYSVDVTAAGNPYDVNASQKLEIIEGSTYTLSFDAWSDTDRPILPGIGLSADPWTNVTEAVNITTTKQTYSVTLIANAGASDARVFFDLGAAVGSVNIDNVSLFIAN